MNDAPCLDHRVFMCYAEESDRREALARTAQLEIRNAAAIHAQRINIPTSDPAWPNYLHSWFATDIASGKPERLARHTPEEIEEAKKAIAIMATEWNPYQELRAWQKENSPHKTMNPKACKYWLSKLQENPTP